MLVFLESNIQINSIPVPLSLINLGEQDSRLTGFVKSRIGQQQSIVVDGNLVGFITPRRDSKGYWRTGAIYIIPKYRNRGYGTLAIKEFFKDKDKCIALIEEDNIPSQKAFSKAGFKKTKKFTDKSDDVIYDIWLKNSI